MASLRGVSWLRPTLGMVAALVLGASIAAPAAAKSPEDNHSDRSLTVMTRNLDAGTDFGYIFSAGSVPDLLAGAAKTYTEVLASNPAARAARASRSNWSWSMVFVTAGAGSNSGPVRQTDASWSATRSGSLAAISSATLAARAAGLLARTSV